MNPGASSLNLMVDNVCAGKECRNLGALELIHFVRVLALALAFALR